MVVMTTEVLRNMIFARSSLLDGLAVVVLDEVHYLQDPYRGSVWEEVLVLTPPGVTFVSLSATGQQRRRLRGLAHLGAGDHQGHRGDPPAGHPPPPLRRGRAGTGRLTVLPLLRQGRPNPDGAVLDDRRRRNPRHRYRVPRRTEVIEYLAAADMLPAITFIFSRAACDDATRQCLQDGIRLTTPEERPRIRQLTEEAVDRLERRRPGAPWGTGRGRRPWRRGSPPTTPVWCRPSARRSSSASPRAC